MKAKLFLIVSLAIFLVSFSSCTQCGSSNNSKSVKLETNVMEYPLMNSYEITQFINEQGIAYNIGITNEVSNVVNYITDDDKALNLGVYGADLAYSSTYNMKKETLDYLKVIKDLYAQLDIEISDKDILTKIEENIDNKDTLIHLVKRTYNETYSSLKENGKDRESILVIAGAWIESLYVATQVGVANFTAVKDLIINQNASLNSLVDLFAKHNNDKSIVALEKDFAKVIESFKKFTEQPVQTTFDTLTKETEILRNQVIQ